MPSVEGAQRKDYDEREAGVARIDTDENLVGKGQRPASDA